MILSYSRNLYPQSAGEKIVMGIDWSPNSQKLGVLTADHSLYLFNDQGERQDKIGLRSTEVKSNNKDFIPLCGAFSPCSTLFVVGQSDKVAYIFRLGQSWSDKKSIVARIPMDDAVTAVSWPLSEATSELSPIIFGTSSGNIYLYSFHSKSIQAFISSACFNSLASSKTVAADNQATPLSPMSSPIIKILPIPSMPQCFVAVAESGLAVYVDIKTQQLRVAARHSKGVTTACMIAQKTSHGRHYLVLADTTCKVTVYGVETSAALCVCNIKTPPGTPFTASTASPSGGGCIVANANGLHFLTLVNSQPVTVSYEPLSSAVTVYQDSGKGFLPQITSIAWRPDVSVLTVGTSLGSVDNFTPTIGSYRYCGAEVVNSAPNRATIKIPHFNSSKRFAAGSIDLHASMSSELRTIKAFPKQDFSSFVQNPSSYKSANIYLLGIGDSSIVIYSLNDDTINELRYNASLTDKFFFDVGACRTMVISNTLGEFTVCYLTTQSDPGCTFYRVDIYATMRGCVAPHASVISCYPIYEDATGGLNRISKIRTVCLGEERTDILVADLMPPDMCDDFSDPIVVLFRTKTSRAIDWIFFGPSGNVVLLRDISGGISILNVTDYSVTQLSTSVGNGIVQWADPFDVIVGQESPDAPLYVWYNPTDIEDAPEMLQSPVPVDNESWSFSYVKSNPNNFSKITAGHVKNISVQAIMTTQSGRQTSVPLDTNLLLFNLLLDKHDILGACQLLSALQDNNARVTNRNLWQRLCSVALDSFNFIVASRCYAALGDLPLSITAREIHERIQNAKDGEAGMTHDRMNLYCQAQIALLNSDLDKYDGLMMSCGRVDEVLALYRELNLYSRAEKICPESMINTLRTEAVQWLINSGQMTTAGMLLAQRGDVRGALDLLIQDKSYLSAFELAKRAMISSTDPSLSQIVELLVGKLEDSRHYNQAAVLCTLGTGRNYDRALALFRKSHAFDEALELARQHLPHECLPIEKEWAEWLFQTGQYDKAAQHYIECMNQEMAVESAFRANNFKLAESLLMEIPSADGNASLCFRLAEMKYISGDIAGAATWLLKADQPLLGLSAFTCAGKFDEAIQFIRSHLPRQSYRELLVHEAKRIIALGSATSTTPAQNKTKTLIGAGAFVGSSSESSEKQSVQSLISRMESLSHIRGVYSAIELLKAAGLYEDVADILQGSSMWDELYSFSKEHAASFSNYPDILRMVADAKRMKGDKKSCAVILEELCMELYGLSSLSSGPGGASSTATDGYTRLRTQASHLIQARRDVLLEASSMYCDLFMYLEAIRLCKRCGDIDALTDVCLLWINSNANRSLLIQQLKQLNIIEPTLTKAADRGMWDVCTELSEYCPDPEAVRSDLFWRRGRKLEIEGRLKEAEEFYVKAGKHQEIVGMYLDSGKFEEAQRAAMEMTSNFERERAMRSIRECKARVLASEGKWREAEVEFIDLGLVEDIISIYRSNQMWQDALRVAKEHGDSTLVENLSESYVKHDKLRSGLGASAGVFDSVAKPDLADGMDSNVRAKQQGNGAQTAKSILETASSDGLRKMLMSAARSGSDVLFEVVLHRCAELASMVLNDDIQESNITEDIAIISSSVQNFEEIGSPHERVMSLAVAYLSKGVPLSVTTGTESKGNISLIISDVCNREQLLLVCKGVLSLAFVESEYVNRITKQETHGDGLFCRLRSILLSYRSMLLNTVRGAKAAETDKINFIPGDQELSRCFEATHLTIQLAKLFIGAKTISSMRDIVLVSSSLVRYCDLLPVDRCFAVAGESCKQFVEIANGNSNAKVIEARTQYLNQCCVFLNKLIDLHEELSNHSKNLDRIDISDLTGSGIPWTAQIPVNLYLSKSRVDEIRSFILELTMDENTATTQELPREPCPFGCGKSIWIGACSCINCRQISPICAVTGCHVINPNTHLLPSSRACQICGCYARPAPWNSLIAKSKNCPVCEEVGFPIGK